MMFRQLNKDEEKQFRQWARDNYKPFTEIEGIWHPVVQEECAKINSERSVLVEESKNNDFYS